MDTPATSGQLLMGRWTLVAWGVQLLIGANSYIRLACMTVDTWCLLLYVFLFVLMSVGDYFGQSERLHLSGLYGGEDFVFAPICVFIHANALWRLFIKQMFIRRVAHSVV